MKYPNTVIDIHTHIFNAHYLPIESIIRSFLGRADEPTDAWGEVVHWTARRIRNLTVRLVDTEPSSKEKSIRETFAVLDDPAGMEIIISRAENRLARIFTETAVSILDRDFKEKARIERLEFDPFVATLVEVELLWERAYEGGRIGDFSQLTKADLPTETGVRNRASATATAIAREKSLGAGLLWSGAKIALTWLLEQVGKHIVEGAWDHANSFVTFIVRLISHEEDNIREMTAAYRPEQNVNVFMHLLMDMELAYQPDLENDPFWSIEDQLRRMGKIQSKHQGLIGFAAFDPRRPNWEKLYNAALTAGFTGLKFYPGMGYRPWDNEDAVIESRVQAFLRRCSADGTPVFTHCSPRGFEPRRGAGLHGSPAFWFKALTQLRTEKLDLRLCLGHAGGGKQSSIDEFVSWGWNATTTAEWNDQDNWARQVVELCREFRHVYCETGHLDDALNAGASAYYVRNFTREWARESEAGKFSFSEKCIFGSDIHMPTMIGAAPRLLEWFRQLFDDNFSQDEFDKFCYQNGHSFLRL